MASTLWCRRCDLNTTGLSPIAPAPIDPNTKYHGPGPSTPLLSEFNTRFSHTRKCSEADQGYLLCVILINHNTQVYPTKNAVGLRKFEASGCEAYRFTAAF